MVVYLNDINNILQQYFNVSLYLKDYYFDNLIRILSKKDIKYPCLMVVPEGGSINKRTTKINLSIIVVDRLYDGETNWCDVLSQTQKGIYDVIAYLNSLKVIKMMNDSDSVSINEVRDTFNDDEVAGWQALVTIESEAYINKCELPIDSMPNIILQENSYPLLLE